MSSPAGAVTIAAGQTSVVVDAYYLAANSQIFLQFDSSLSSKLGVTCNTTYAAPYVSARTAGNTFTISVGSAPTTNPACFSFFFVN